MTAGPRAQDWFWFFALVALWGTAFAITKVAVASVDPALTTTGRLWIGAALLIAWCRWKGERLPPLWPRPDPLWLWLAALGFFGNAAPFFLIASGQTRIDSALAAILTAAMPLMTAALAHAFVHGEHMTWRKAAGLTLGFGGVAVLVGPSALRDLGGPATLAQFAVLAGAFCYAVNVVVARRTPSASPRVVAAGMVLAAAVMATPFGVAAGVAASAPSPAALAAVAALGLGATGVAAIVYMQLVRSAGPTFLAQANFLTPVTGVAVGWRCRAACRRRPVGHEAARPAGRSGSARRCRRAPGPRPVPSSVPPARFIRPGPSLGPAQSAKARRCQAERTDADYGRRRTAGRWPAAAAWPLAHHPGNPVGQAGGVDPVAVEQIERAARQTDQHGRGRQPVARAQAARRQALGAVPPAPQAGQLDQAV